MEERSNQNLIVMNDETKVEDFDGDSTMENMLKLFLLRNRRKKEVKEAVNENEIGSESESESENEEKKEDEDEKTKPTKMDIFSFVSFIIFLCVNVFCSSYNLYKAIVLPTAEVENDMLKGFLSFLNYKSITFFNSTFNNANSTDSIISSLKDANDTGILLDKPTKILYFTEFSFIMVFALVAIYYYICLYFNPDSLSALSGAANFTRLVREFSCFSLVPLFNVSTLTNIYSDIANTFEEEKKKYSDRSELWDGIWGVGTKDVQKSNGLLDLNDENEKIEIINSKELHSSTKIEEESKFKKFKHSKFFLFIVSIAIYTGFIFSFIIVVLLAVFAFIALYIKARHVGKFISTDNKYFIYKWFNFITFITNIASLNQQSPAIKLIIYQLKVLTRKAHINEYRRRKQNRIKENQERFEATDKETVAPKIIIHRKKIHRSVDDNDIKSLNDEEMQEIDADKLSPNTIVRKNSKLSTKSANSL